MVFRAERYPRDWKKIRARILTRAGNTCECAGECGDEHPAPTHTSPRAAASRT